MKANRPEVEPNGAHHPFSADRPIEKLEDDILQRGDFARSIARAITAWNGTESLVMALYAGWGDGKSSVKGMVIDAFRKPESPKFPYIVHFNPWEWSGQNQLAHVFFDEIGKQVEQQGKGKDKSKTENCGKGLKRLGKYLNLAGSLMTPVGYAANLAFPFASLVTEAAAKGLKQSGDLATQAAEVLVDRNQDAATSLPKLKEELKADLQKLDRNIVVFVDDIDRLAADEIKLLFQLIKANSDFPHLIFFLFFQQDIIETALEKTIQTGSGREYLRKIVQVPLTLPSVQPRHIRDFITNRLQTIVSRPPIDGHFDWGRFEQAWNNGCSPFFRNLRDVNRFLGVFEFDVLMFQHFADFDPVDLFALTVLKVFEGDAYRKISTQQDKLVFISFNFWVYLPNENLSQNKYNLAIEFIVHGIPESNQLRAREILKLLFRDIHSNGTSYSHEDGPHLQRRGAVAHPMFFQRYFHLCLPNGDISESRVLNLKNALGQSDEFAVQIEELAREGLAAEVLFRLCSYNDGFDLANLVSIAEVLVHYGDRKEPFKSVVEADNYCTAACALLRVYITKAMEKRRELLFELSRNILKATRGVCVPMVLIYRLDEFGYSTGSNIDVRRCKDELAQMWEAEVLSRHAKGTFVNLPLLLRVLTTWKNLTTKRDQTESAISEILSNHDVFLQILRQIQVNPIKSNETHKTIISNIIGNDIIRLQQLIPANELIKRIQDLKSRQLNQDDQLAIGRIEELIVPTDNQDFVTDSSNSTYPGFEGVVDVTPEASHGTP
jgi:predicted KAP-like P-loop ATPase